MFLSLDLSLSNTHSLWGGYPTAHNLIQWAVVLRDPLPPPKPIVVLKDEPIMRNYLPVMSAHIRAGSRWWCLVTRLLPHGEHMSPCGSAHSISQADGAAWCFLKGLQQHWKDLRIVAWSRSYFRITLEADSSSNEIKPEMTSVAFHVILFLLLLLLPIFIPSSHLLQVPFWQKHIFQNVASCLFHLFAALTSSSFSLFDYSRAALESHPRCDWEHNYSTIKGGKVILCGFQKEILHKKREQKQMCLWEGYDNS